MAVKYDCVTCKKQVTATKNNRYRSHTDGTGEPCGMAGDEIPEHVLANPVGADDAPDVPREGIDFAICPQCDRKAKLTRMGYFEPHDTTLRGGERCPVSGVRAKHARKTETVPLPGDEPKGPDAAVPTVRDSAITSSAPTSASAPADSSPKALPPGSGATAPETPTDADAGRPPHEVNLARQPMASSPESTSTPPPSEQSTEDSASSSSESVGPFPVAPAVSEMFLQPFSPFSQPGEIPVRIKLADSMNERGKEVATRLREIFYAYTHRNSSDNRSAQRTLGPSEVGSPCDRQIAMKLLGIRPVNPQEGWAPFVGTAVHAELAKMFEWANGSGSGRFVVEMPLQFGSPLVPRGTGDLLDRVVCMFLDHKLMGRWSLDKLIQEGPSETYRKQVQIYGLGAELAGEKVREVAIVAWPRQESSLDKLYVHVEPYDRKMARAALDRVSRIAAEVDQRSQPLHPDGQWSAARPMEVAREFPGGDDCKWCPFHLPKDKGFNRGCPGK